LIWDFIKDCTRKKKIVQERNIAKNQIHKNARRKYPQK